MVSLTNIQSSNSLISSKLPSGLVAVFVGATSGIGEITLKTFAKYTKSPRVYFVGRSQDAADRIGAKCRTINPDGEYIFIKADISLIRIVDEVCAQIKKKEKNINLLVLSAGVPSLDRRVTSENLHLLVAAAFYSRIRFTTSLLPLIKSASSLRRIVCVAAGGKEGPLDPNDFPALRVPFYRIRGHLATLISLALEGVAKTAPEVSFVHDYPGAVDTPLKNHMPFPMGLVIRSMFFWLGRWVAVPIEESGERHLFLATSASFKPVSGDAVGVDNGTPVAVGTNGEVGSGVYSVGWDCESSSPAVRKLLAGLRSEGMVEKVLEHTEGEFRRIAESG